MEKLKTSDNDSTKYLVLEDFEKVEQLFQTGELTRMLDISFLKDEIEFDLVPKKQYTFKFENLETEKNGSRRNVRTINDSSLVGKKIIVFGDSFIKNSRPYFAQTFEETLWIQSHKIDFELIEREKPSIVIHIIPERNISFLQVGD